MVELRAEDMTMAMMAEMMMPAAGLSLRPSPHQAPPPPPLLSGPHGRTHALHYVHPVPDSH